MTLLSSYVSRSVLAAMLLVLVLLLGLELVFAFLGELSDVRGNYSAMDALLYVALSAPRRAYDMLPIAALVGGIAGLGMLASSSELTVMRAAGTSIWRIVWWVIKPSLAFVIVGLLLAQYAVPVTEKLAEQQKRGVAQWTKSGWQREGADVIQLNNVGENGQLQNIVLFNFSDTNRLNSISHAEAARYDGEQGWWLQGLRTTYLSDVGSSHTEALEKKYWPSQLTPEYLGLLTQDIESLSLTDLYHYANYMKAQGLDADSWFLQFWKKAFAPFATLSMVLIACSFIFGPLRSVTMGLRILAGVMAGLLFRYGQDFLGFASLLYDFSPVMAAGLPVLISLLIGGGALARTK